MKKTATPNTAIGKDEIRRLARAHYTATLAHENSIMERAFECDLEEHLTRLRRGIALVTLASQSIDPAPRKYLTTEILRNARIAEPWDREDFWIASDVFQDAQLWALKRAAGNIEAYLKFAKAWEAPHLAIYNSREAA